MLSLGAFTLVGLSRSVHQREAVLLTLALAAFTLGFVASLARAEALSAAPRHQLPLMSI